jgi:hypothetical protein
MAVRLIEVNLDAVLWEVMTDGDATEALVDVEVAELHRLARAADALAALCYGLAGPRPDNVPVVIEVT